MKRKYRMLIGGIGDDAHSIAINLLTLGFKDAGFYTFNLGIRNDLSTFFKHARDFDIIMISNKNGHAELYLENFPKLLSAYNLSDDATKLWYLGGSLSVNESDHAIKKKFLGWGFTDVYPKPVSFQVLYKNIMRDIHVHNIRKKDVRDLKLSGALPRIDYSNITNGMVNKEEMAPVRQKVLKEWVTGRDLVNGDFDLRFKDKTSLDSILWNHKTSNSTPLLQPRTGVADIHQQTSLLKFLEEAGSDINSVQLDAASRSKFYSKAAQGLQKSVERGHSILNGFPIPIHGVEKIKNMILDLKQPFQLRGGGPDHRLTYEIALGAGASGVEGGAICYLMPYDKNTNPGHSMQYWQYVDRLCTHYEELHGQVINREYFGVLTATLIEPSIAICVNILQSLLSAQQGIKSISVGYAEQGNRHQDVAAIQVMEEMVLQYLNYFKYKNCRVTTVFHQYMAAFPTDNKKAEELIRNSAMTATLAKATKIMVKTSVESFKIPDKYDNARALDLCRQGIRMAQLGSLNPAQLDIEKSILRQEVNQLMGAIMDLGSDDLPKATLRAIEEGIIDIPWSPSIFNKNEVVAIRDMGGAIRFREFGNMPFSSEVKEFHQEKILARENFERKYNLFELLEEDLSRIWKNDYATWPLDNSYLN